MFTTFEYFEYNYDRSNTPLDPPNCKLIVGEQYAMRVDGEKWVRVLLITPDEIDEHNERRAHVVILENNPYTRAGAECRPLAFTLSKIP